MSFKNYSFRPQAVCVLALVLALGCAWAIRYQVAQAASAAAMANVASFDQLVKPFLTQNCVRCHNVDTSMSGVRVDQLDGALEDRHIRLWEDMLRRISEGSMPPKGQPQPTSTERTRMVEWITQALEVAKLRPAPKNGMVRRLTIAQYRNTLRELLQLEDDLTEALPPDAVSSDGFGKTKQPLQRRPQQQEGNFEMP